MIISEIITANRICMKAGSKFLPIAGGKSRERAFSGSGSHNHLCVQAQELGYLS